MGSTRFSGGPVVFCMLSRGNGTAKFPFSPTADWHATIPAQMVHRQAGIPIYVALFPLPIVIIL